MTSNQFLPAKGNLRRPLLLQNTDRSTNTCARSMLNWRNLAGHLSRLFIQIAGKRLPTLVKKPAREQECPSPPGVPVHSFNATDLRTIRIHYGETFRILIVHSPGLRAVNHFEFFSSSFGRYIGQHTFHHGVQSLPFIIHLNRFLQFVLRRCWDQSSNGGFQSVGKASQGNGREWIDLAENESGGFKVILADNGNYFTESIAVPTDILMASIRQSLIVNWEDREAA